MDDHFYSVYWWFDKAGQGIVHDNDFSPATSVDDFLRYVAPVIEAKGLDVPWTDALEALLRQEPNRRPFYWLYLTANATARQRCLATVTMEDTL